MKKKNKKRILSKNEKNLIKAIEKLISATSRISNSGYKFKRVVENYGFNSIEAFKALDDFFRKGDILNAYTDNFAEAVRNLKRELEEKEQSTKGEK